MKLFHRHKWTPWKPVLLKVYTRRGECMTEEQERTCQTCGLTKRRDFL